LATDGKNLGEKLWNWLDEQETRWQLVTWANGFPPERIPNQEDHRRFVKIIEDTVLLASSMGTPGPWDWSKLTPDDFAFLKRLQSELNPPAGEQRK
jgi:hypothetical protein